MIRGGESGSPSSHQLAIIEGVSSPVGTRGHATTVNNEIVMNLFMNLFLVS